MKKVISVLIAFLTTLFATYSQSISRKESVQSLYIEVYYDTIQLGRATGFIIESKTQKYLITNWHVVTNKDANTGDWLDEDFKKSPNRIAILHNSKTVGRYTKRYEKLVDLDGKNTFYEFGLNKEMIDVIALPLKDTLGDVGFYPVQYINDSDSLLLQPTDRLFVLGFPKGVRSYPALPIWKSGLIASEPDINQEGKPIVWLDINSYGGMSGSPVYLITNELTYKDGSRVNVITEYTPSFFMGVFSHGLQNLGIGALWKNSYLKKIFNSLP